MSMTVLTNIDMKLNQLLNMILQNLSSDPSGTEGRVYWDTVNHKERVYNGTVWQSYYVDTVTLDAITAPAGNLSMNSHKITNVTDPTSAQDAATKSYVDAAIQGLSPKDSCRAATTANITLSGTQTIDGISIIVGDRVLVKNQTLTKNNGIYVCASGSWSRAVDADTSDELEAAATFIEEGSTYAGSLWTQTATNFTLGTDPVAWTQFSTGISYTGGAGLTLSGTDFSVNVDGSTLEINSDTLRVKDGGITAAKMAASSVDLASSTITGTLGIGHGGTGQTSAAAALTALGGTTKYAADITGDGSTTGFAVTHSLGTKDVLVQIYEATTDALVIVDVVRTSTSAVTINFASAPALSKVYRVVVVA